MCHNVWENFAIIKENFWSGEGPNCPWGGLNFFGMGGYKLWWVGGQPLHRVWSPTSPPCWAALSVFVVPHLGGEGAHVILELDQPPGHQNPPLELSSYLLAHPTVLEGIKNVLQNSLEEILETNSRMSSVSGSRGLKMCTELPYTICNSWRPKLSRLNLGVLECPSRLLCFNALETNMGISSSSAS